MVGALIGGGFAVLDCPLLLVIRTLAIEGRGVLPLDDHVAVDAEEFGGQDTGVGRDSAGVVLLVELLEEFGGDADFVVRLALLELGLFSGAHVLVDLMSWAFSPVAVRLLRTIHRKSRLLMRSGFVVHGCVGGMGAGRDQEEEKADERGESQAR